MGLRINKKKRNNVTFNDALKQKSIIKMDIVTLQNGRFIEITEVYIIFIDGESNSDNSIDNVRKELTDDMKKW